MSLTCHRLMELSSSRSELWCSDALELDALCVLSDSLLFVLSKRFHFRVFEQQRDEPLIEPVQVLRILRPRQVLSPLYERPDCVTPHQLIVRHLQAKCAKEEL